MTSGVNRSEEFVTWLCQRAFLKLWTHANPIGKKGKELCDCLVVCGVHVVIISVKEIVFRDTGDKVGLERWHKATIEKSAQQIWGAERWLNESTQFERKDGRTVELPPKAERKYHRISVSLGAHGKVPIPWGNSANGFVHVFDEYCMTEVFRELDTITDFVDYLSAVESLFERGVQLVFAGGGPEDLLAYYVRNGTDFGFAAHDGDKPDIAIVTDGIWKSFVKTHEYATRKQSLESSYSWDRLIESYAEDLLTDGMFDMHSKLVTKNELALAAMALQPRGHRANLAESFIAFLTATETKIAARAIAAGNATAFVFLCGDSRNRDSRVQELSLRCLVVRGRCPGVTTVVGIATDKPKSRHQGHSTDLVFMSIPIWTEKNASDVDGIQRDLGYFKNTKWPH